MADLASRRKKQGQATRPQPQVSRQARQQRQQTRRPRQVTVKKDETYASLAEKHGLGEDTLIQSTGFDRLVAGQVINLPEAPLGPHFDPAEVRAKTTATYRAQEVQSANDAAIIAAYKRQQSGAGGLIRTAEQQKIRSDYEALLERRPDMFKTPSQAPTPPPVGAEILDAITIGEGDTPFMTPEEEKQNLEFRRKYFPQIPADAGEYARYMLAGGATRYNPETGEMEEVPYTGESLADAQKREAQVRRAEAMDDYYSKMLSTLDENQIEQVKGQIKPQTGEPLATEDYPVYTGSTTYSEDGLVYYAKDGRVIPADEFQDYLKENRKHYDNLEDYLNSDEGQKHVFIEGTKKDLEGIYYGLRWDDRDMFPDFLTPAQLEMYDPNRDWDDYMRNVLNYRWDAENGTWVKQEDDDTIPLLGYGGGGGGGLGGGYASGSDWKPGSGQTQRGGTGKDVRADKRFAQIVDGIAQVHWRL